MYQKNKILLIIVQWLNDQQYYFDVGGTGFNLSRKLQYLHGICMFL